MLLPRIRDSYSAQVWLEGSAVAFLDSLYPDDELSVQIARYISDGMKQKRKRQPQVAVHPFRCFALFLAQ